MDCSSVNKTARYIPSFEGDLRSHRIQVPNCISDCTGIRIFGRRIKSIAFTTDVAVIRNINSDAVMAVYPFTPQPAIANAIMQVSEMPVFVGVGGGVTKGVRVLNIANNAELSGAFGVIVNSPTENEVVHLLKRSLEIPVIVTVVSHGEDIEGRLNAGADILNVAGAAQTAEIVASIRQTYPEVPIIATGGKTEESITQTIRAGANAITYTPPSSSELFATSMARYRAARARPEEDQSATDHIIFK